MIIAILLAIGTAVAVITAIITVASLFSHMHVMDEMLQHGTIPEDTLVHKSEKLTDRFYMLVACITVFVILLILLPVITG